MARMHRVRAHTRNGRPVRSHYRRNPGRTARGGGARPGSVLAFAGVATAMFVLWLAVEVVRWIAHHWWIIALLVGAAAVTGALVGVVRSHRARQVAAVIPGPRNDPADREYGAWSGNRDHRRV